MHLRWTRIASALWLTAAAAAFLPAHADPSADDVRAAALRVYWHGMTDEIAAAEVGRSGIGELLRLLEDPAFPRHDNVVAFLAHLGGAESSPALIRLMVTRAPWRDTPEDRRAELLIPHALGHLARRGDGAALQALLAATADRAAARLSGVDPSRCEAAVMALGIAGTPAARERLAAIADGRIVPDARHPELASRARAALMPATWPLVPVASAGVPATGAPDPADQAHQHGLTFTNHASTTSPMTSSRLDEVLDEASRRAETADASTDVACCAAVARSGNGGTFGSAGDGLDSVNDAGELNAVIGQSGARVKVVNVINFCAGTGTNIIGCSYTPGGSMVVVRLSNLGYEAVLWIHEYGHNLGLDHSGDSRAIMFGSDNGQNNRLAASECAVFHAPPLSAHAAITVIGSCTDDGDTLADPIDNCPDVANDNQSDSDDDGIGDACEGGGAADIDGSGRVDGLDLARFGRAFGSSAGNSRYDAASDIDGDGQIDGADLALLAAAFGK